MRGLVPVRNPVTARADDPVQCAARRHERRARQGGDDGFDQSIDGGIGNAGEIVGAFERRGLGGEKRSQRIPRRRREAEAIDGDIEVERVAPRAILHGVDNAQASIDAERLEITDERHVMRLE